MFNILRRFDITDGSVKVTSYVVRVAGSTDEALVYGREIGAGGAADAGAVGVS